MRAKPTSIYLEYTCQEISPKKWRKLLAKKRKVSYKFVTKLIREHCPEMVVTLALDFYNPWEEYTFSTPTHYIITHSTIEYFFRKVF